MYIIVSHVLFPQALFRCDDINNKTVLLVAVFECYLGKNLHKHGSPPDNHRTFCGIVVDHEKIATEAPRASLEQTVHEGTSYTAAPSSHAHVFHMLYSYNDSFESMFFLAFGTL
jgi:hypothetical protein